jgi:hypothetical protein
MASFQSQTRALTLAEALAAPRLLNRDTVVATEPMPNLRDTPGGPRGGTPLTFRADWTLASRPRRVALLMDDAQKEYRTYAAGILPHLQALVAAFRARGCKIAWSSWSRQVDDAISNAMDRWYGPRGGGCTATKRECQREVSGHTLFTKGVAGMNKSLRLSVPLLLGSGQLRSKVLAGRHVL